MSSMLFCDECKFEFSMKSVEIQEAAIDGKESELKLLYFTCPKCNKIYRISLKDERYEELKDDLERTKLRIRKNHGSHDFEFASTLDKIVRSKQNRLRNYTDKLNRKFPGTFVFAVSENGKDKIIKYLP